MTHSPSLMTGTRLVAVGHFQPERVVPNSELETMVETSDEWIQRRVGIKERRWAAPEETVDVMAEKAALDTLAKAGMTADQVDLVIVATCSALDRSPNMAARVAHRLGITGFPATIDVNTACSGFPHAVALAQHAIAAGASTTALVIGSEKLTDVTDFTDRTTCVLTADGAGAFLLTADRSSTSRRCCGVVCPSSATPYGSRRSTAASSPRTVAPSIAGPPSSSPASPAR